MATPSVPHCSLCSCDATKLCGGCKSSRYCSSECQETDWASHKLLCKPSKDFTTPPKPNMKRGILFPANSKVPTFVWAHCRWSKSGGYESVESEKFMQNSATEPPMFPRVETFNMNRVRQRRPRCTIELKYRDEFMTDGSAANQSIREATKRLMGHEWRGPVLAFGKRGFESPWPYYEDLTVADFRDVVDLFTSYGDEAVHERARYLSGKVAGVKVACQGDMTVCGSERFQTVEVPRQHPVFKVSLTADVPRLLGFLILMRRCAPDPAWRNGESVGQRFLNQAATSLQLIANKDSSDWGSITTAWQDPVGSVLVVRQDGKPLSPLHLEVLCAFCQYKVGPLVKKTMQVGDERRAVLKEITPEKFALFFEAYRKRMAEASHEWRAVASPYAV